jgi:predicted enzyme related to lactoylglutathione lyase
MGRPVVHFEIVGKDAGKLHDYYAELFDWNVDTDNPMGYGLVKREDNLSREGEPGIGGGIGSGPEGYEGHVTFYVPCPTWRRRWPRPRASAGPG